MKTVMDPTYHAHHFIFSFTYLFILFIPCGRLSWLNVSFLVHVKYTLSYINMYLNITNSFVRYERYCKTYGSVANKLLINFAVVELYVNCVQLANKLKQISQAKLSFVCVRIMARKQMQQLIGLLRRIAMLLLIIAMAWFFYIVHVTCAKTFNLRHQPRRCNQLL